MALLLALSLVLQTATPQLTTIARSTMSHIDVPRQAVVRTQAEWTDLWKAHAGTAPPPKVDFAKATVVAVFLGERMTAGYAVEIVRARMDGATLVVSWSERKPGGDQMTAQIVTSPAHIVSIPAFPGEIRFEKADK